MWKFAQHIKHQTCGRAVRGDAVFLDVSTRSDGTTHGAARGLVSCSSVWCCPVCSAHIRTERAQELAEGVQAHREAGGSLLFATLTLQHQRGESLGELLDVLYAAWRKVQQQRGWRGIKVDLSMAGFVRSLEITYGINGWHPHLHALLFFDHEADRAEADRVFEWLRDAWTATLARMGRYASPERGVTVQRVTDDSTSWERLAGYTVKGESIHHEVARADRKGGRLDSVTPMQLLDHAGDGEAWAIRAWLEYEEATAGRRAIEWSRGLRDLLGVGQERADSEIVEDEVADNIDVVHTETVAVLAPVEWSALCAAGLDYHVLEVAAGNVPDVHWFDVVTEAMDAWHARRRYPTGGT